MLRCVFHSLAVHSMGIYHLSQAMYHTILMLVLITKGCASGFALRWLDRREGQQSTVSNYFEVHSNSLM